MQSNDRLDETCRQCRWLATTARNNHTRRSMVSMHFLFARHIVHSSLIVCAAQHIFRLREQTEQIEERRIVRMEIVVPHYFIFVFVFTVNSAVRMRLLAVDDRFFSSLIPCAVVLLLFLRHLLLLVMQQTSVKSAVNFACTAHGRHSSV